jgi:pilus assembly protein Flp/PilA
MCKFMRLFLRADFLKKEEGATAIEYGMIAALIFLAIVGGVQALGAGVANTLYNKLVGAF